MKKIVTFIIKYVFAALASLYLLTLGMIFAKNRAFLNTIAAHFGWNTGKKSFPTIVPKKSIEDILKNAPPISLRATEIINGNVSLMELILINSLIAQRNPANAFEIGTFDGRTTLNLAVNTAENAIIYTLDLPPKENQETAFAITGDKKFIPNETRRLRFLESEEEQKIKVLHGDSARFDFSPYREKIDFIFVDGAHTYKYVMNDSKHALEMASSNAVIIWHDYGSWEGVTKALNELYQNNPQYKNLRSIEGTTLAFLICF